MTRDPRGLDDTVPPRYILPRVNSADDTPGRYTAPSSFETARVLRDRADEELGIHRAGPGGRPNETGPTDGGSDPSAVAGTTAARSRARRREIVQAAAHLFAERGYRSTSLRDISQRVGISHPGMLHHFKNKETLLEAVIDDLESHAQHVIDNLQVYLAAPPHLETTITSEFAEHAQRTLLLAVLTTYVVNPEHPARLRIIRLRRVWEHITERILRIWDQQGRLRPGIDPAWGARTMISLALATATREASIGSVQPSAGGMAARDFTILMTMFLR